MGDPRFDIEYVGDGATISAHYCREWDENGGCYGTNPDHGYSFEEACDHVAQWYEQQAKLWRERQHHNALRFSEQLRIIEAAAIRQQDEP
ncbi:hypothetical protein [Mesorhizobium sp. ESP-6-2]|uniref:hypothetical protein n=1 Tax=Mesorhizobium sp. ESP-6-2 TaxID=2876625 RepID=UPI001CCD88C5|nr:hypothetical protein [Mesorhizobium sp. ESP-6-2]MBZ9807721.1 hypothetical protein [Mesorhizobium sp. ESP-6-2]